MHFMDHVSVKLHTLTSNLICKVYHAQKHMQIIIQEQLVNNEPNKLTC